MIRRHPWLSILAVLVLIALGWGWTNRADLQAFPSIIGAYSAKEYCSCRYVMNNPPNYCEGYIKQYIPLSELLDDQASKRVTARGLGSTHTAQWQGQRQGCQLLAQPAATPDS
tara:strand:+ start:143 stop:481 length:339 start_codon:yes stop_codon:yes gene_type:complete